MDYKKLSYSLDRRISLLRSMDFVPVLIISNSILRMLSGSQYRDVIRNPMLIKDETTFWDESVNMVMNEIRPDYIKVGRSSTGDMKRYAGASLIAFDLAVVFVGYGLGNKLSINLKKTYLDMKKRGFPYLKEEILNMKEFEKESKITLLPHANGKRLKKDAMERMFTVPLYFSR